MAEHRDSSEDALLTALLRGAPVADDGFSECVTARIRRRLWMRRLLVPAATLIGASIAALPVATLLTAALGRLMQFGASLAPGLQPAPTFIAAAVPGILLLLVLLGALRMLED